MRLTTWYRAEAIARHELVGTIAGGRRRAQIVREQPAKSRVQAIYDRLMAQRAERLAKALA